MGQNSLPSLGHLAARKPRLYTEGSHAGRVLDKPIYCISMPAIVVAKYVTSNEHPFRTPLLTL